MTISMKRAAFLLTGTIAAGMYGSAVFAADFDPVTGLPAVSGPNGKVEFSAGYIDLDDISSDEVFRGGASLSFPVGDMFGIQADVAVVDAFSETGVGGTLHFFTRDPETYLLGGIVGYADFGPVNAFYGGPEVEFYLDNISIEAVAGVMDLGGAASGTEFFAMGDVALYATENLRLSLGAATVAGFASGNAGLEWFMSDLGLPASLTLNGRLGEEGFTSITAGFSVYFGGEDKSLIRRHREDDPKNRSLDIFGAAAGGATLDASPCPPGQALLNNYCEPVGNPG
jgi:hypothetical protein